MNNVVEFFAELKVRGSKKTRRAVARMAATPAGQFVHDKVFALDVSAYD
jgi:hypothetical protein